MGLPKSQKKLKTGGTHQKKTFRSSLDGASHYSEIRDIRCECATPHLCKIHKQVRVDVVDEDEFVVAAIAFFNAAAGGIEILPGHESELGSHVIVNLQDPSEYMEDYERTFRGRSVREALENALKSWNKKTGEQHHFSSALLQRIRCWKVDCKVTSAS